MNVRLPFAVALFLVLSLTVDAQNALDFTVHTDVVTHTISPWVYGANVLHNFPVSAVDNVYPGIPSRRFGGDRVTGYNWENNYSNGGVYVCDAQHPNDPDYCNPNDDALPFFHSVPAGDYQKPGAVLKAFQDVSVANGAFSLVQLPMAGYVARDGNGPVPAAQSAPSSRWVAVVNRKGAPLSTTPDAGDDAVYVDEEMNFLLSMYGSAATGTGVKAYEMDNEPDIWYADGNNSGTHPRLYPQALTVDAFMRKTRDLAATIRAMDPDAQIFGPAFANYAGYYNLHGAPDWDAVKGGAPRFVEYYLAQMNAVSAAAGVRLLDAFTFHWYSQTDGVDGDDVSPAVVEKRLQAPRSLWDPTYVEESWITKYVTLGTPIRQLRDLQDAIDANYPGTGIGVTEWRFGAKNHISGGLATADALGIFGREGVRFATFFDNLDGYARAAFDLYRNFTGNGAAFGSGSLDAEAADDARGSIYATMRDDMAELHIVAINKTAADVDASIHLEGMARFLPQVRVYGITGASPAVAAMPDAVVAADNTIAYRLPAYSAAHMVLTVNISAADRAAVPPACSLGAIHPDPADGSARIPYAVPAAGRVALVVRDLLGRAVVRPVDGLIAPGTHVATIDVSSLRSGVYVVSLQTDRGTAARTFAVVR